MESVAMAKLMLVQPPVKMELLPLNVAVIVERVSSFAMELTDPVIVETKELDSIPIFMDMVELDVEEA